MFEDLNNIFNVQITPQETIYNLFVNLKHEIMEIIILVLILIVALLLNSLLSLDRLSSSSVIKNVLIPA